MSPSPQPAESRFHFLAVALVVFTFPLICLGGLVTTEDAGMAVPDWPTTYGYNLFLYPWQTWLAGPYDLFIEHGHRLLGALVGMLAIAVAAAAWMGERRVWVRWLALAALAAVIVQGVLGGLRVNLDQRLLAQIHGTFGPAFFALAVALAVVTSRRWREGAAERKDESIGKLARLATATTIIAFLQLAVGARVRHIPEAASPAEFQVAVLFHLLLAAVLVGHAGLLAWRARRGSGVVFVTASGIVAEGKRIAAVPKTTPDPFLVRPAQTVAALVAVQVLLGLGTWVARYGFPTWFGGFSWSDGHVVRAESIARSIVITAHAATGSLIVAAALTTALRAGRLAGWAWRVSTAEPLTVEAAR